LYKDFETLDSARARPGQLPHCYGLARDKGWSYLGLVADGLTWFRDPAVFRYVDRLVEDTFFEDFDHVLFYGAGPAGHAAAAYAVAATGATVLAISPRAAAPVDSSPRYADAPRMLMGAGEAIVISNPDVAEDSAQAAQFASPNVLHVSTRCVGEAIEARLAEMSVLPDLIIAAAEGRLDRLTFAKAWRKRRDHAPYRTALRAKADARGLRCAAPGPTPASPLPPVPAGPSISERLAALAAARSKKP
jgi:hypothetical protein